MNNVKIKVECSSYKFINYLVNNNINYSNLIKSDNNYIFDTSYENYLKIRRRYNTLILRYYGKSFIINFLKTNKYLIISFFICMFILFLLCNTIYDIEIYCDEILHDRVSDILNKYDIKKYKRVKSYNEINFIKKNMLSEIDDIEWIEITRDGVKYIVNVNRKLINSKVENNGYSDIVASRDGVIKHIVVHNGEKVKEENEYVKKGEVIISGDLYKDEDLIDRVNAKGEVFAEVWYLVKIEVPLVYKNKTINKKINHYYLDIFNKKFSLIGYYNKDYVYREIKSVFEKPYLPFKLYKEEVIDYSYEKVELSYSEAIDYGVKLGEESLLNSLNGYEYVISKNVLKNRLKSSKMYIEVFFKVYKDIASTSYKNEKETIDEEYDS